MSESLVIGRARARRPRPRVLQPTVLEWKTEALRRLGWQSRTDAQQDLFGGITETSERVLNAGMRGQGPHGATATQPLLKGSGREFKDYHELRTTFEGAQERTPEMVAELKAAAQRYIDHYNQHDKRRQRDPKNIAKKDACEATIKEMRKFELAAQVQALGEPPWDSAQAMEAASVKTALDIASLPPGEQRAEALGGEHLSPAFWINRRDDEGKTKKAFIFKPEAPTDQPGYPNNGEPAREALSARVTDMLNGALGLSLPVPETHVVSLGKESLPPEALNQLIGDGFIKDQDSYVGSVQQFEATQGELRDMTSADRGRIPVRATQELAVLDTILLNTDRHPGNFLVKPDQNGTPQLVPIDQGLCFPTRGSESQIRDNIGGPHNALLGLAGSHEPFTQEMQDALARLDPDALAGAMKQERGIVEDAHPSTQGAIADESIEMSRRSAMFLKRAAPRLTPASVQVAISRFQEELFDPELDMNGFDTLSDRIIGEMEQQQEALKEYFLMPPEMQDKMKDDLAANGWDVGKFRISGSVLSNPAHALKLWKTNTKKPDVSRDPSRRPLDIGPETPAELEDIQRAFPKTTIPEAIDAQRVLLEDWRDWKRLNATPDMVREACALVGIRGKRVQETCADVSKAVTCLRQAASVRQTLANDNTDETIVVIRNEVTYLETLLPTLSSASRMRVTQTVQRVRGLTDGDEPLAERDKSRLATAVSAARAEMLDEARTRVLQKIDTFLQGDAEEGNKYRMKKVKPAVTTYAVVYGYEELAKFDKALADAP